MIVSAPFFKINLPALVDPVKDTKSISGWDEISVPTPAPSPSKPNDYEVINPSTEEAFATISLGSTEDTNAAVSAAKKALVSWSESSKDERLNFLKSLNTNKKISNVKHEFTHFTLDMEIYIIDESIAKNLKTKIRSR